MNYILISLLLLQASACYASVVLLHGPGSTGKTSICRELGKDAEWKEISDDDIFIEELTLRYQREYVEEFEAIAEAIEFSNIFHAIVRNQVLFKSSASDEMRERARKAIRSIHEQLNRLPKDCEDQPGSWTTLLRKKIAQMIIDASKTHKVVADSWLLRKEHYEHVAQTCRFLRVLVYCPFSEIVKRMIKRNSDALITGTDISNIRFFRTPLQAFIRLYTFSEDPSGSIDIIEREKIVRALDIVEICLQHSSIPPGAAASTARRDFSVEELTAYRKELLGKFVSQTVYLIPKEKFDLVVRSDHMGPSECAKLIKVLVGEKDTCE